MKDAWLAACDTTIQNFVRDSTRLEPGELSVVPVDYIDFYYQISLRLIFNVRTDTATQAGRVSAGLNTDVCHSRAEYERALQAQTSAILARDKTLDDARASLLSRPYGDWKSEEVVYLHPMQACLTENCNNCHGSGSVNCGQCHGSGKTSCCSCGGSGQVLRHRSYYDHYSKQNRTESYYESCSSCYGGRVTCNGCGGSGNKQCSPCSGTGIISHITSLKATATPDYQLVYPQADVPEYIREGLYKTGVPSLGNYGPVALTYNDVDYARRDVHAMYDANVPFGRLESPLPEAGEEPIRWILYGVTPHILDAGHVLQALLKNDLDMLVRQATPGKRRNPFVGGASRKTVQTFMESEAHQAMLIEHSRGKRGDALREALNRAFATPYLNEAIESLGGLVSAVQRWSLAKWSVFTALMMYLLLPVVTTWQRQGMMNFDTGRIYLTAPGHINGVWNVEAGLRGIAMVHGIPMLCIALVGTLVGYLWRSSWLNRQFGKPLTAWGKQQGRLRSRWLLGAVLSMVIATALLLVAPVWISQDEMLYGVVPVHEVIQKVVQWRT
ncbi:DnaJ-like cysteine-rich domain-containing protein [Cronobacter malonaticus]